MLSRWKVLLSALLLSLSLLAAACGQGPTGPECPVRIGVITSRTGRHASGGQESIRGYEMALDEINAAGGILGCQVELVVRDDESMPYRAQLSVKELVNEERVPVILGAYSSAATMPAAGVATAYQIPFVVPTASSDLITTQGYRWVFRLIAPASGYANTALDFVQQRRDALGLESLAIVYDDSLYGESAAVAAATGAAERGIKVVAYESYDSGTTDLTALVRRVKAAEPDVVYLASYLDEAKQLMQLAAEQRLNPKVYLGHAGGFIMLEFLQAGRYAEYVIGTAQWAKDVKWQDANGQTAAAFDQTFTERYGVAPGMRSAQTYTALYVVKDAIERAGQSEALDWRDDESVRLAIRDALRETDMEQTIFGPVQFDQAGQNDHPVVLVQVVDGSFVTVYPEQYRAAAPVIPVPPWSER